MTRLYVIDGNGLGHWLWHTSRKDPHGSELTLADATTAWFREFCERLNPSHVAVVWDGANNWRWKESVEYKSARRAKPPDEEKNAAIKTLDAAWSDLGVQTLRYDTFEADDAMAALCNVHASPECEVVIVSSDKDMMQCVDECVKQYDPRPNKANECVFYDAAAVEKKHGVPPHRVADLLAIMGDASDSVPGIKGWGKVKAVNAVRQTKSMTELIRKVQAGALLHVDAKNQAAFVEQLADLEISRRLVSLRVDVPVPTELDAFKLSRREAA